jgi:hypothetical protein
MPAPCFPGCRLFCEARNQALARNWLPRKGRAIAAGAWKTRGERIICYSERASRRAVQLERCASVCSGQPLARRASEGPRWRVGLTGATPGCQALVFLCRPRGDIDLGQQLLEFLVLPERS